jgi:hypothetical protein
MKRIFWLGVGATLGVAAVRKITRTAESFTPSGIAGSFAGLGDVAREFADDVRAGMRERERDLMDALGVDADGTPVEPPRGGALR